MIFNIIKESKRSELPDSEFGIPEDRKFPLNDREHVVSAIKLFGHAEESKKKALAKRIKSAAKKYDVEIPETTQVYKYLKEESEFFPEDDSATISELETPTVNEYSSEGPIDTVYELLDNTDPKHIYLSSDWHFFSLKYKKEKNPVNTRDIVKWCKDNIKDDDIFMYLGDMCYRWASKEDNEYVQNIFKSLPGKKILIIGNHEAMAGEGFYLNCGFDYVFDELTWKNILFSHKPKNVEHDDEILINIHGHKH